MTGRARTHVRASNTHGSVTGILVLEISVRRTKIFAGKYGPPGPKFSADQNFRDRPNFSENNGPADQFSRNFGPPDQNFRDSSTTHEDSDPYFPEKRQA